MYDNKVVKRSQREISLPTVAKKIKDDSSKHLNICPLSPSISSLSPSISRFIN